MGSKLLGAFLFKDSQDFVKENTEISGLTMLWGIWSQSSRVVFFGNLTKKESFLFPLILAPSAVSP